MVTNPPPGFDHNPEDCSTPGSDDVGFTARPADPVVDDQRGNAVAVAGLAREVEGLRRQVDALEVLPGRLDHLADTVVRLAEMIRRTTADDAEDVTSWLDLPRVRDHAARVLDELVDWLGSVYLRYPDAGGLPECWMWHPDIVEELVCLMQTWQAAYHIEGASVTLAADWHDRYRPGVARRITQTAGNCSIQRHRTRDGRARPGTAPEVPLTGAAPAIADWWAQARAEPAPEPTDNHVDEATAYAYARDQEART